MWGGGRESVLISGVIDLCGCRELEAKLGATPPPSPSDRNSPALLTSRIAQLSAEVDKLRRMLQQTEAQSGFRVHYDVIMMQCFIVCVA